SQVVRADREAVEPGRELLGEDHIGGDLAHHVDLEPADSPLETVLSHHPEHAIGFGEGAAERDHDDDVPEPQLLTHSTDGAALEREAVAVARVVVAGGPAEP